MLTVQLVWYLKTNEIGKLSMLTLRSVSVWSETKCVCVCVYTSILKVLLDVIHAWSKSWYAMVLLAKLILVVCSLTIWYYANTQSVLNLLLQATTDSVNSKPSMILLYIYLYYCAYIQYIIEKTSLSMPETKLGNLNIYQMKRKCTPNEEKLLILLELETIKSWQVQYV